MLSNVAGPMTWPARPAKSFGRARSSASRSQTLERHNSSLTEAVCEIFALTEEGSVNISLAQSEIG